LKKNLKITELLSYRQVHFVGLLSLLCITDISMIEYITTFQ
jgi:hypothetical protein